MLVILKQTPQSNRVENVVVQHEVVPTVKKHETWLSCNVWVVVGFKIPDIVTLTL